MHNRRKALSSIGNKVTLEIQLSTLPPQSQDAIRTWNDAVSLLQWVKLRYPTPLNTERTPPNSYTVHLSLFAADVIETAHGQRDTPPSFQVQLNIHTEEQSAPPNPQTLGIISSDICTYFLQRLEQSINAICPNGLSLDNIKILNPPEHCVLPKVLSSSPKPNEPIIESFEQAWNASETLFLQEPSTQPD